MPKAQVYVANRRKLQGNLPVPTGSLTEKSEPIRVQDKPTSFHWLSHKTRIVIIGPEEEDYYCRSGNAEETRERSSKCVVGREPRWMDDGSCVWGVKGVKVEQEGKA